MRDNSHSHYRKSIRLQGYDYALPGGYFVTIATHKRKPIFGRIVDFEMELNSYGEVAVACWEEIPSHFEKILLDAFVIMPNHVHGIILTQESQTIIENPGATTEVPPEGHVYPTHAAALRLDKETPNSPRKPASLGVIMNSYKAAVTKILHRQQGLPHHPIWQSNYYERIIRNERELNAIRAYILENPLNWTSDPENKDVR